MSELSVTKTVRCPGCGRDSLYSAHNPYRPFCSERCKNIDLGAWSSEAFRVPAPADPDEQLNPSD